MNPKEFYTLTLKEVLLRGESWRISHNLEWERSRWLGTLVKNGGVVARGQKVVRADLATPEQMFQLPQDKIWRKLNKKPKTTAKGFEDWFNASKKTVKYNSTPNFDKIKEVYL